MVVSFLGLILTVLGFVALFTLGTFLPFILGVFLAAFGIGKLIALAFQQHEIA